MYLLKIEIIISNTFLQGLLERLEKSGIHGYTALEIFRSKGIKKGEHLSEGLLPITRNSLVFSIGHRETVEQVIENIKSFIRSEALWG